jgi:hypothetical protein
VRSRTSADIDFLPTTGCLSDVETGEVEAVVRWTSAASWPPASETGEVQ